MSDGNALDLLTQTWKKILTRSQGHNVLLSHEQNQSERGP